VLPGQVLSDRKVVNALGHRIFSRVTSFDPSYEEITALERALQVGRFSSSALSSLELPAGIIPAVGISRDDSRSLFNLVRSKPRFASIPLALSRDLFCEYHG
jgi:hypothetical protein